MMRQVLTIFPLIPTLAACVDLLNGGDFSAYSYLAVVWIVTALVLLRRADPLERALRWLRWSPFFFWLIVLAFIAVTVGFWYAHYQPVMGRLLNGEMVAFAGTICWTMVVLLGVGWTAEAQQALG
ncbi:MAG: hypothetical protein KC496_22830, partial [Anaerolineae bacterium]|nr:hypothetical protein [Anaerolineae bacterium]